ncbi:MAG: ACP S-malonyltransferase [Planctomycetes bacterium]|nr:ACP S-malonyltransferase [Planctomycetota bacterium]
MAGVTTGSARDVAFIFPGQGAQTVGMGRDLCAACPAARRRFETANRLLGFDLAALCFHGPEERLRRTDVSQPAIFVTSLALLDALGERLGDLGPHAAAAAGLSLGEYTALVFAQALPFDDALRLVASRGRWMQEACDQRPGAMASLIGLAEDRAREVCEQAQREGGGVARVANVNEPEQIVISGDVATVTRASSLAKAAGARRAVELKVAGAFHSPLMLPAQERLAAMIAGMTFRDPATPVFCNVTGAATTCGDQIKANLVRQLTAPVLWLSAVRAMAAAGARRFWEVGPGAALTGMVRRIDPSLSCANVASVADLDAIVPTAAAAPAGGGEGNRL